MEDQLKNSLISNSCQTDMSYENELKVYKELENYIREKFYKSVDNSLLKITPYETKVYNNLQKSYSVVSLQFIKKSKNNLISNENKLEKNKIKSNKKPSLKLDDLCWKIINKKIRLKLQKLPNLPAISSLNNLSPNHNKNSNSTKNDLLSCSLYKQKREELYNKLNLKNLINKEKEEKEIIKSRQKINSDMKTKNNKIIINYKLANWENTTNINSNRVNKNTKIKKIIELNLNKNTNKLSRNKSLSHLLEFNRKENKIFNSPLTKISKDFFENKNFEYKKLYNTKINNLSTIKPLKNKFKYLYNNNKLIMPLNVKINQIDY